MLQVFKEYIKNKPLSYLVIIGDGDNKEQLQNYCKDNGIEDKVLFLGNKDNANEYYNVFDLFVLSSIKEGLPYVLLEAQVNGLHCISSNSVDHNSDLSNSILFLSLDDDISIWCKEIRKYIGNRKNNLEIIINSGYSIHDSLNEVKKIYEK